MSHIYSQKNLEKLLGLSTQESPKLKWLNSENGPGNLSLWLLLEGRKDCWQQSLAMPLTGPKKPLIISNPFLAKKPPDRASMRLWESLIEHFDVYLWPGSDKPLKDCQPLRSTEDFWKKRSEIVAATAEKVEKSLVKQNLSPENYLILDYLAYDEFKNRLKQDKNRLEREKDLTLRIAIKQVSFSKTQVNISRINLLDPEERAKLEAAVEVDNIQEVTCTQLNEEELQYLLSIFPNLGYLRIKGELSEAWQKKMAPLLKDLHVFNAEQVYSTNTKMYLYEDTTQKEFDTLMKTEETKENLKFIDLFAETPDIDIRSESADVTDYPQLQELQIRGGNPFFLRWSENDSIKNINLDGDTDEKSPWGDRFDPSLSKNLQQLSLSNLDLKSIKTNEVISLRELSINTVHSINSLNLNLALYPNLLKLTIADFAVEQDEDSEDLEYLSFPRNYPLRYLALRADGLKSVDLSNLNHLEELILEYVSYEKIKWPATSILKRFKIKVENSKPLDFSHLSLLEDLEIEFQGEFHELILPKSETLKRLYFKIQQLAQDAKILDLREQSNLRELGLDLDLSYVHWPLDNKIKALELLPSCPNTALLDLSTFPQLTELAIDNLTEEQLKQLEKTAIKFLEIRNCSTIEKLDLSKFPYLESLIIKGKKVPLIKSSSPGHPLRVLNISREGKTGKGLKLYELSTLENLENFILSSEEDPTHLSLTRPLPHLKNVEFLDNTIGMLEATHCPELQRVNAGKAWVNLSGCTNLRHLKSYHPQAINPEFQLKDCKNLHSLIQPLIQYYSNYSNRLWQTRESSTAKIRPTTTRFNLKKARSVDNNLNTEGLVFRAQGSLSATIFTADNKHSIDDYRIMVFDAAHLDSQSGKLIFYSQEKRPSDLVELPSTSNEQALNEELIKKLQGEIKTDPHHLLCYMEGLLLPNEEYPLPNLYTAEQADLEIYTDPPKALRIFWSKDLQQHFVKLADNITQASETNILYRAAKNPHYRGYSEEMSDSDLEEGVLFQENGLLADNIKATLNQKLSGASAHLNFIFNPSNLSLEAKIKLLSEYCNYPNKNEEADSALTGKNEDNFNSNSIDALCQQIINRRGACRHRAQAFMLLARMIGVRARYLENEQHAVVEIPYQLRDQIYWRRIDLGGWEARDESLPEARQNKFTQQLLARENIENDESMSDSEEEDEGYEQQVQALIKSQELSSITDLLSKDNLSPPLIELESENQALKVATQLVQQLQAAEWDIQNRYIYINRPEEFEFYLRPWQLKNGSFQQLQEGLLHKVIANEGIIAVNWSNFNDQQRASYQSILDTIPKLFDLPLGKTKVISLIQKTKTCSSFSSRIQPYSLTNTFFNTVADEKMPTDPAQGPLDVDLFNHPNWREYLYGQLEVKEEKAELQPGKLIEAITQQRALTIYNPPKDDPEFDLLIYRLQHEQRFVYNGETLHVPAAVKITLAEKKSYSSLKNVFIHESAEQKNENKELIYLSLSNLHDCVRQLVKTAEGVAFKPGLLHSYQEEKQIFYLTEDLPLCYWQALLAEIQENHTHKKFHFKLAPGVQIENIASNTERPRVQEISSNSVPSFNSRVITSNDPDFECERLVQQFKKHNKEALIIDINPKTSFSDLLINLEIGEDKKFIYQELGMLQALKEGRPIILNGELSPTLYQQLLPFLSPPACPIINGESFKTASPVFAVMPARARTHLKLLDDTRQDYDDLSSYLPFLLYENKENRKWLKQMDHFYRCASKLPHRGIDRPEALNLSYHHLQALLNKLQENSKFHPHNPIKGLINYAYPNNSEDYAYLNVLGKFYFCHQDPFPPRIKKLARILEGINLENAESKRENVWRLLNCFSGKDLNTLFRGDLEAAISDAKSFPELSASKIEEIYMAARNFALREEKEIPKNFNKESEHLNQFFKNNKSTFPFIKGLPGVGKTYMAKQYSEEEADFFTEVGAWLEAKAKPNGKKKILLLDESNMYKPGELDFLKGLYRHPQCIYYNKQFYHHLDNHLLRTTGNPESFPLCFYHPFLQNYSETLYVKNRSDAELKALILAPILDSKFSRDLEFIKNTLLSAYHLIMRYNPFLGTSIRDLENLSQRFLCLLETQSDPRYALLEACIGEFAGSIEEAEKRQDFIQDLEQICGVQEPMNEAGIRSLSPDLQISSEKEYLVKAIDQAIKLRNKSLWEDIQYKSGLLIEGPPGLGKSTLVQTLMKNYGFNKDSQGPQKYYEINAGSKEARALVDKAFHEGSCIVIDELNLDPLLQKDLHHYLTGKDPKGNPPQKRGAFFIGLQNSGHLNGRQSTSTALINRTHFLYMDPYKDEELVRIAKYNNICRPEHLVKACKKAGEGYTRIFFKILNKLRAKQPSPEKVDASMTVKRKYNSSKNEMNFSFFNSKEEIRDSNHESDKAKKIRYGN